jgi:ABC-type multidrug transport system fused ATPase/permease subunit
VFDGLSGFINKVMQLSEGHLLPMAPSLDTGSVHAKVLKWLCSPDQDASLSDQLKEDRHTFAKCIAMKDDADDDVVNVHNLTWGFGGVDPSKPPLFQGANFALKPGSRCILTGSNGCGKTTLLSILGGSRIPVGYNDDKSLNTSISIVGVDPVENHAVVNREVCGRCNKCLR